MMAESTVTETTVDGREVLVLVVTDDATGDVLTRMVIGDSEPAGVDRYLAAEQARRTAYDNVIAGKTKTLALLDAATKAGSDAYIAYLEAHPA